MDDVNKQDEVNALRKNLEALNDEINLKEKVRQQMSKNGLDSLGIDDSEDDEEVEDADEEAISEIEAFADEQLAEFDNQLETIIKGMEEEDMKLDNELSDDGDYDIDALAKE